jgi:ApaG protein
VRRRAIHAMHPPAPPLAACAIPSFPVNPPPSELPGLEVSVDDVQYMPSLDAPADRPFPFVYFITIRNLSKTTVTVKARKWVVKQQNGETIVVEGDGVVGQFPRLEPGGEFSYNSCHTIGQNSEANGAFFAEADDGKQYYVRIPTFLLELPTWV